MVARDIEWVAAAHLCHWRRPALRAPLLPLRHPRIERRPVAEHRPHAGIALGGVAEAAETEREINAVFGQKLEESLHQLRITVPFGYKTQLGAQAGVIRRLEAR